MNQNENPFTFTKAERKRMLSLEKFGVCLIRPTAVVRNLAKRDLVTFTRERDTYGEMWYRVYLTKAGSDLLYYGYLDK